MGNEEYFGKFAGVIWSALNEGDKTMNQLNKATGLTMKEIGMGLGWLAREGKIVINNAEGMHLTFSLLK